MRYAIATILFLFSVTAFGQLNQFRMVGSGSWSVVNDSTYSATVTFASDLTANSFLPTGVVDSMRVFTQRGQLYTIDSVGAKTFSTAVIYAVEYGGDWGSPSGQVLVYETRGRETVPAIPFATNGATSKLQEAVVTHNAAINNGVSTTQLADSTTAAKSYTDTQVSSYLPPKDTIVQASHGFSIGDPIWYSGNYLLALDTGLTVRVDGIVSDSLDVNTFVLQRTGKFTLSSHGFTVGIQLYVQPDGSYSATDTSNTLVYGYALDANTIEIGVKPDAVRTVADRYNDLFAGRGVTSQKEFLDSIAGFQSFADAISIQSSSLLLGYIIENRETRSRYKIESDSVPGLTVDGITQIRLSNNYVAQLTGDVKISEFLAAGLSNVNAFRTAISYADNRQNEGGGISRYVYVDVDSITLNDTIAIPGRIVLKGLASGGLKSKGYNTTSTRGTVIYSDLNDASKCLFTSTINGGGGYAEGWGITNISIHAISPALAAIRADKPGYVEFDRVFTWGDTLVSGGSGNQFFTFDMILDGPIHCNFTNSRFNGADSTSILMLKSYWVGTSTNFVNCQFKGAKHGIVLEEEANNSLQLDNCTFESTSQACIIDQGGNEINIKDLYTENVASGGGYVFSFGGASTTQTSKVTIDGFRGGGNGSDTLFYTDHVDQFKVSNSLLLNFKQTILTTANTLAVDFDNVREVSATNNYFVYDEDGISNATTLSLYHVAKREGSTNYPRKTVIPRFEVDFIQGSSVRFDNGTNLRFYDGDQGTPSEGYNINIDHSVDPSAISNRGSYYQRIYLNNAGTFSSTWSNINSSLRFRGAGNIARSYDFNSEISGFSSGTPTLGTQYVANYNAFVNLAGSGAYSMYRRGFNAKQPEQSSGSGTLALNVGFYAENQGESFVTNSYGLYIENQSGSSGNNYSIYTGTGTVNLGDSTFIATVTNPHGGSNEISAVLDSLAFQYRTFTPIIFDNVDTLLVDRLELGFESLKITKEIDGKDIIEVTFTTDRNVTADTSVRLEYFDISASSYTSFGSGTIVNGTNQITVTGLTQTVEAGDMIYVEVVSSGGEANGISATVKLQ